MVLWFGRRRPFDRARIPAFAAWHCMGMVAVVVPFWIIQQAILLLRICATEGLTPAILARLKPGAGDLLVNLLGVPLTYGAILMAGEAMHAAALAGQLAEARLALLQRQIHPHFLFNALQAVSTLLHRDPAQADRTLVSLSSLLRRTLDDCGGQETPLGTELELVRTYLDIEKVRFQDRLDFTVEAGEGILDRRVPSLILLPLVENAIRHGLSAQSAPGRVTVKAFAEGGGLRLSVADTGPGADLPVQEGIGLGSTRQRLEVLYGGRACLELRGQGGFLAEILLPPPEARP